MSMNLKNKVAVVTGAGRGLGRAVALNLAEHGAAVALTARSESQLRETDQAIRQAGGKALSVPADVGKREDVDRLRREVEDRLGTCSILVNVAGVFGPIQLIQDTDPDQWVETLMINSIGPFYTSRAFVKGMIEQKWGRIVNFTSAAALFPPAPLFSAYATSKVALNHFTRLLATELAGTGVTANVIHPGEVKTEMWAYIREVAGRLGPEGEGYRRWAQMVQETGGDDPQKAARLVLRLVSDESATVNGQFLWIEDGLQKPLPSWSSEEPAAFPEF